MRLDAVASAGMGMSRSKLKVENPPTHPVNH